MSIRDLYLSDKDETRYAQICVIGAGFAGLIASMSLIERGYQVVLLESGRASPEPDIDELNRIDTSMTTYAGAMTGRLRGLGGTSRHWGGRLLPLTEYDTGPRPHLSLEGWPFSIRELDVYTEQIERLFGIDSSSFEDDIIDQWDPDAVFPRADPDFRIRLPKWPSFSRRNLDRLLRQRIARSGSLELHLGSTVCDLRVDTESRQLQSVTARSLGGRTLTVCADHFLLAAGTIETTRLMLLLDAQAQHRPFEGCAALGHYFQDHMRLEVGQISQTNDRRAVQLFGYDYLGRTHRKCYLQLRDEAQAAYSVASAYAEVRLHISEGTPLDRLRSIFRNVQRDDVPRSLRTLLQLAVDRDLIRGLGLWRALRQRRFLPPAAELRLDVRIEQIPCYENRITLSDQRDSLGVPLAKLQWHANEIDVRTFRNTIDHLRQFWSRAGLDRICPILWNPTVIGENFSLTGFIDTSHPSGTTRMGTIASESVVNADLRCHAIPNVWIASASTFPTAGSANPTFTILQLALRAADSIVRAIH
jgi:choline dehydrogenase-like flavoprotein